MLKRKINFHSIVSLTTMKTSTFSIKPHQLEAKEAENTCLLNTKTQAKHLETQFLKVFIPCVVSLVMRDLNCT